jgi:hypothetical protein
MALYALTMCCLKLVVLLFRGYRSRDCFPTRRRDVSATLNGVAFQRTEIFTFQTMWVVADITHTEYQLEGISIRFCYCYRILTLYKIVLAFWFLVSKQSQIGRLIRQIARWYNRCSTICVLANNLEILGPMTHHSIAFCAGLISLSSSSRSLTLHFTNSNSLLKNKE